MTIKLILFDLIL